MSGPLIPNHFKCPSVSSLGLAQAANMNTFANGDTVRLIMGGPNMTAKGLGTAPGQVWCEWFDGRLYHGGSFDEQILLKIADAVAIVDEMKNLYRST